MIVQVQHLKENKMFVSKHICKTSAYRYPSSLLDRTVFDIVVTKIQANKHKKIPRTKAFNEQQRKTIRHEARRQITLNWKKKKKEGIWELYVSLKDVYLKQIWLYCEFLT